MKTVKFKELPEKVQEFLRRESAYIFKTKLNFRIDLDWLHKWDKWSLATDDERLAYAEWRYRKGVSYSPIRGGVEFVVSNGEISIVVKGLIHETENGLTIVNSAQYYNLIYSDGQWAEIIEEPDALTKAKQALHDHIQSNPEKVKQDLDKMRDLSNEFKAGDEVDGQHNSRFYTDESFIYTGGKNTKGEFICEQKVTGRLFAFTEIRKIDPNKAYREIAKEIIGNARVHEFTSIEYITVESAESMLIEALKKGKEL